MEKDLERELIQTNPIGRRDKNRALEMKMPPPEEQYEKKPENIVNSQKKTD